MSGIVIHEILESQMGPRKLRRGSFFFIGFMYGMVYLVYLPLYLPTFNLYIYTYIENRVNIPYMDPMGPI